MIGPGRFNFYLVQRLKPTAKAAGASFSLGILNPPIYSVNIYEAGSLSTSAITRSEQNPSMLAQLALQEGEALVLLKEYLDLVQVRGVSFDFDFHLIRSPCHPASWTWNSFPLDPRTLEA